MERCKKVLFHYLTSSEISNRYCISVTNDSPQKDRYKISFYLIIYSLLPKKSELVLILKKYQCFDFVTDYSLQILFSKPSAETIQFVQLWNFTPFFRNAYTPLLLAIPQKLENKPMGFFSLFKRPRMGFFSRPPLQSIQGSYFRNDRCKCYDYWVLQKTFSI